MRKNKSILPYLFIALFLIIGGFIIFSQTTQATVPVEVMRGTLDTLKKVLDIQDTDEDPDLQAKIIGGEERQEGEPLDVTITRTQKLRGSPTDKEDILNAVIKNIEKRLNEIKNDPKKAKEKADLEKLKSDTETLKEQLAESVALDVNIVKNSSQVFEELRNVAREQLARKQVGQLTKQMMDAYEAAGISYTATTTDTKKNIVTNYKDFLFEEPLKRAENYLDNKHFAVNQSVLNGDETEAMKEAVKNTIKGPYRNPKIKPENTLGLAPADILDASKGGGWDKWLLLAEPNNNPYGIYFSALEAANEVAAEATEENQALNIAGQGTLPLTRQVMEQKDGVKVAISEVDASQKYEILESAGVVKEYPIIAAQGQMALSADPKTASIEEETIYPPGSALSFPTKDEITGGGSEFNVDWQTDVLLPVTRALEDVIDACFPGMPSLPDIFPGLPGLPMPGLEICGRFFGFCDYFPEVCANIKSLPGAILDPFKESISKTRQKFPDLNIPGLIMNLIPGQ